MASTRIIYSKNELLALAPLADSVTLPDDILAKFNIIEVNDSTPITRRRDVDRDGNNNNNHNSTENHGVAGANTSHNAASATMANHHHNASSTYKNAGQINASVDNDGSGGGGGGNININAGQTDRRGYNNNNNNNNTQGSGFYPNNNNNNNNNNSGGYNGLYNREDNGRRGQMTDRFSVPSRNWRGNRDIETFEEGYKYELERNAAQQRHVMETMQREDEKKEQVQESQMAKANKLAEEATAASTATTSTSSSTIGSKEHEHDEIEKLLANITTADNGRAKVARSRFFNPSSETSDKPDSVINKFGQTANGAGSTGQSSFFGLTTSTSSGLKDLMLHKMTNTNNDNYTNSGNNTTTPEYSNNNSNNHAIKSSESNMEMYNHMNKSSGNVMHGTNFHLDHTHNLTSFPLMTNQTSSSNNLQSAALAFATNQTSRPENTANTTEQTDKVHDERIHLQTPHTENNTAGHAAGTNVNANILSTNTKMNTTPQM